MLEFILLTERGWLLITVLESFSEYDSGNVYEPKVKTEKYYVFISSPHVSTFKNYMNIVVEY